MANCLGGQYGGGILPKMRTPRLRLYIRRSRQMRRREISRPANSYTGIGYKDWFGGDNRVTQRESDFVVMDWVSLLYNYITLHNAQQFK